MVYGIIAEFAESIVMMTAGSTLLAVTWWSSPCRGGSWASEILLGYCSGEETLSRRGSLQGLAASI